MSCECAKCRQHYRTLGFTYAVPTEAEIQDAYQELAKQWDPAPYQDYPSMRADAEEHLKQIQVAYKELQGHNTVAVEAPAISVPSGSVPVVSVPIVSVPTENIPTESVFERPEDRSSISFGGAPGCQSGPHFTPEVEEIISRHLGKLGMALAIVDITGARSRTSSYAQFLLIAQLGIMMRDKRNMVSLLWHKDLGEINLIDKQKHGKPGMWQSLFEGTSGSQPKNELEIYRNNGMLFCSISSQADDSVKDVIYNFLQRKKDQAQS